VQQAAVVLCMQAFYGLMPGFFRARPRIGRVVDTPQPAPIKTDP
jgi:hypothetical protein